MPRVPMCGVAAWWPDCAHRQPRPSCRCWGRRRLSWRSCRAPRTGLVRGAPRLVNAMRRRGLRCLAGSPGWTSRRLAARRTRPQLGQHGGTGTGVPARSMRSAAIAFGLRRWARLDSKHAAPLHPIALASRTLGLETPASRAISPRPVVGGSDAGATGDAAGRRAEAGCRTATSRSAGFRGIAVQPVQTSARLACQAIDQEPDRPCGAAQGAETSRCRSRPISAGRLRAASMEPRRYPCDRWRDHGGACGRNHANPKRADEPPLRANTTFCWWLVLIPVCMAAAI